MRQSDHFLCIKGKLLQVNFIQVLVVDPSRSEKVKIKLWKIKTVEAESGAEGTRRIRRTRRRISKSWRNRRIGSRNEVRKFYLFFNVEFPGFLGDELGALLQQKKLCTKSYRSLDCGTIEPLGLFSSCPCTVYPNSPVTDFLLSYHLFVCCLSDDALQWRSNSLN